MKKEAFYFLLHRSLVRDRRVEVWKGCIWSFYRSRHERQPRFKSGKRLHLSVSNHKRHREMIRWYVQKIRAERGGENDGIQKSL